MTRFSHLRRALTPVVLGAALAATALQVTALTSPASALAAHSYSLTPLLGHWVNVNPATRSIVRINIAPVGSLVYAHSYGACVPTACDWGATRVYGVFPPGYASYTFSFAIKRLVITRSGSFLQVVTYTYFTDHSGRSKYKSVDYFKRLLQPLEQQVTP